MVWLLEDPSMPLVYNDMFREYSILSVGDEIHSYVLTHCPQDGELLPASLRDGWFERTEALGLDISIFETDDPSVPEEMRSGAWWRNPTGCQTAPD